MKIKIILFAILLMSVFCLTQSVSAMTEEERQALIAQLQAQLAQLQAQLQQMLQGSATTWCHDFNTNLVLGNTGSEVASLHIALQKQGLAVGTTEQQSQTFGDTTFLAVKNFQEKYASEILYPLGLTQGTGKVASATRAKLNNLYGCGTTITPPTGCTPNWQCGSWSTCNLGQQTRTCYDANYCGVIAGEPSLIQNCATLCSPDWQCGSWTPCSSNQQTRSCIDYNFCGISTGKPTTNQACTVVCVPQWQTGLWSTCNLGQQTRTVTDANNCGVTTNKPETTQTCTVACAPQWQCGNWSTCYNNQQTRTCYDVNYCGVTTNKPAETQACTATCTPQWQCGNWGACSFGQQTRTCTDSNNCGTPTKTETQSCTSTSACSSNSDCGAAEYTGNPSCNSAGNVVQDYTIHICQNAGTSYSSCATQSSQQIKQMCSWNQICQNGQCMASACASNSDCGANGYSGSLFCQSGNVYQNYITYTCSNAGTSSANCSNTSAPTLKETCSSGKSCVNGACVCSPNWVCGNWGVCYSFGQQMRTCTDSNNCGTPTKTEIQNCSCTPDWDCTNWSECYSQEQQRTCTDSNNCGTNDGKPSEWQRCCTPGWMCMPWGECVNYTRTRACGDIYFCGTNEGRPPESESCGSCASEWNCTSWSACANSQRTRTCTDTNYCPTPTNRPSETESCCATNWQCTDWSACAGPSYCPPGQECYTGRKTRTCSDANNCGVLTDKPIVVMGCFCTNNWQCGAWSSTCNLGLQTRTCTDIGGCSSDITTETQACAIPGQPTVDIKANGANGPLSIPNNTSVALIWTTTNATSCTASGDWSGSKNSGGGAESTINLTSSKTYTITCANSVGTVKDSVIVNPTGSLQVNLKANNSDGPITLDNNSAVVLTWTTTNATSCTASGDWSGSKIVLGPGSEATEKFVNTTVRVLEKTYNLTCTNSSGASVTDTVRVYISTLPLAPTADIKINNSDSPLYYAPQIPATGSTSYPLSHNLTWSSTSATSCTASATYSMSPVSLSGGVFPAGSEFSGSKTLVGYEIKSFSVNPQLTHHWTYAITCTGSSGMTATDSVEVYFFGRLGVEISYSSSVPQDQVRIYTLPGYPTYDVFFRSFDSNLNPITPAQIMHLPASFYVDKSVYCFTVRTSIGNIEMYPRLAPCAGKQ